MPGVQSVHATRARWLGHRISMELHIAVDGTLPLAGAHQIAEQVRHELLHHITRLNEVIVHVDPAEAGGETQHAETAHHFENRPPST